MAGGGGGNYTLRELVDLSLCSPEIGAVNFNLLHRLLHAILSRLDIREFRIHVDDLQWPLPPGTDNKFLAKGQLKVPTSTVRSTLAISLVLPSAYRLTGSQIARGYRHRDRADIFL